MAGKKGRSGSGGRRAGAGRPPSAVTQVKRLLAEDILKNLGEENAWKWVFAKSMENGDVKTFLSALMYLTDRRDGRPPQAVTLDSKTPVHIVLGFQNTNGTGNGDAGS